jgi:hypothetical protein
VRLRGEASLECVSLSLSLKIASLSLAVSLSLLIACVQAARLAQPACIAALIEQKADVGLTDKDGKTAADLATDEECRRLLSERPIQVPARFTPDDIYIYIYIYI